METEKTQLNTVFLLKTTHALHTYSDLEKSQGRCTSGDLSVSGLSPFICIYLDCDRREKRGKKEKNLRARHDRNKTAPCGMIKVFELN